MLAQVRAALANPAYLLEAIRAGNAQRIEWEKNGAIEAEALKKRINRIQIQIDRLVTAISDTEAPIEALMAKLKPLEAERVGLMAQLERIEKENVVTALPKAIEAFQTNIERLHDALSRDANTIENRNAFRCVVDRVIVHPTGNRMPLKCEPMTIGGVRYLVLSCFHKSAPQKK